MKKHLEELKRRHRAQKGIKPDEIIDSDQEDVFDWIKWLNPQDGKDYIRVHLAAREGFETYTKKNKNIKAGEARAIAMFGERGKGEFNEWLETDFQ